MNNIIDIIKTLASIDNMNFSVPTFMRAEELLIGATDVYGNTIAVYEDNQDCNKNHIVFSRDHRLVAHYVLNEELRTIIINEDETLFSVWTSMTGLITDIINLLEKEEYVVVNKPIPVIPLEPEVMELLKEIIKANIENCTNIVHLDELKEVDE